jgi:pimeloyl-ACP methyl ester carboxylesterase
MAAEESQAPPGWLLENFAATSAEMMALELEGWADSPTSCAYFPRVEAPTLIVCGELENADGSVEPARAALPDGEAVILQGLGHLQAFWRCDLTAPHIAAFLDAHVPAGMAEPA